MGNRQHRIAELMAESGVGFGTSGARGRVADMTPEVCFAYTRAFLDHMRDACGWRPGDAVAIAGDLRPSTPDIMSAVACAVRDAGGEPVNCGFIPSPAVALYGIEQGIPAIMVTGSHIPDDRNGIKFNRPDGEILKDDEAAIRERRVTLPALTPDALAACLPEVDGAARRAYARRYVSFFGAGALAGRKVGVYEHSSVARDLLCEILEALGARIVRLARSATFIPVDTEAIRPEDVRLARDWAAELGVDAIVSTDGDADRPLISDEQGNWLRGDVAGILCARFLGVQRVVTPVSSNSAVEGCGAFEAVLRTRIGSPFVIAGMQQAQAGGGVVAGYEANGGFLLATPVSRNGRTLAPLPTRDAVIVILALLVMAAERGQPLSALVAGLPPRFTASDRLKAFPTARSREIIAGLMTPEGEADAGAVEALFGDLAGRLVAADTTDGLRLTFDSGEVIHLRPSGNAPEFRCYNEADSPERAAALNAACLERLARLRPA